LENDPAPIQHTDADRTIRLKYPNKTEDRTMRTTNYFAVLIFFVILGCGIGITFANYGTRANTDGLYLEVISFLIALIVATSIKIADQWENAVVLRLGRFQSLRGPGLFFIIPVVDMIPYWIDKRVITSSFTAEKTLTKDTVPVDVDAVLFWKVFDPQKAALDVADYQSAIKWASQTALRDVIGKTMLSDMLEGREKISNELQKIIDERTEPWGINVISVEVKDVLIPSALEDAMSMQAQAERERQARVILGDSERQVAQKFAEAAESYSSNPTALHLRAMNMLYEGLKTNSTIVIVPSTALETMQLGGLAGMTAMTMGITNENQKKESKPKK
jgi:regulator of protease activity HflC (stomatin/prohibitin superfamily)